MRWALWQGLLALPGMVVGVIPAIILIRPWTPEA